MIRKMFSLACAIGLSALALAGCGGSGADDADNVNNANGIGMKTGRQYTRNDNGNGIGSFGTGYGSNGTRLFERDDDVRLNGRNGSGMFGSEDEANGSRDGGGAGWFGTGKFTGLMNDSDKSDATRGQRIGNGFDGIRSDGAGTSDPRGAVNGRAARSAASHDRTMLVLGNVMIVGAAGGAETGAGAAGQAGIAGNTAGQRNVAGQRVLRVTNPAALKALQRLNRSLQSGQLAKQAEEIADDLRMVLKNARETGGSRTPAGHRAR